MTAFLADWMESDEYNPRLRMLAVMDLLGVHMDTVRCVVIDGNPITKARPRFGKGGRVYTPRETEEGERRIAAALSSLSQYKSNVVVSVTFYRNSLGRVDADNLMKAVLDGATKAGVWVDDMQVTALFGFVELDRDWPRTEFAIGEYDSTMLRGEAAMNECEQCGQKYKPYTNRNRASESRWCSNTCKKTWHASRVCIADGCDSAPTSREMCGFHYRKMLREQKSST